MTENSTSNKINSYQKNENKDEMKKQVISFGSMILFTVIAFAIVASGSDSKYVIPILFVLAVVQAMFQFFYFMHMKDKGHEEISGLIYGGFWVTFLLMLALGVITWW